MCLYYNARQMNSNDFTYDSAYMAIACYGEIASGMFVLFLPMLPRFFTHMKEVTSTFNSTSQRKCNNPNNYPNNNIGLGSSDIALRALRADQKSPSVAEASSSSPPTQEAGRKPSLWHISYTERDSGSDDDIRPFVHHTGGRWSPRG